MSGLLNSSSVIDIPFIWKIIINMVVMMTNDITLSDYKSVSAHSGKKYKNYQVVLGSILFRQISVMETNRKVLEASSRIDFRLYWVGRDRIKHSL